MPRRDTRSPIGTVVKALLENPIIKKIRNYSLWITMIIAFIALIFLVLSINLYMRVNFDYTDNGTYTHTELSIQSVPTVINGIIASTSVIIGFSGVIIGLMYREINVKSEIGGTVVLVLSILFVFAFYYELNAFFAFSMGGQGFLEYAYRNSLTGFIFSLFTLFITLLMINQVQNNLEKKQRTTI